MQKSRISIGTTKVNNWFEMVQIRRPSAAARNNGWEEYSQALPLACAIQNALEILKKEIVYIQFIRPQPGTYRLDSLDIVYLSRRSDYPYFIHHQSNTDLSAEASSASSWPAIEDQTRFG